MTVSPRARASCTAPMPTPPLPPWTSTVSPASPRPGSVSWVGLLWGRESPSSARGGVRGSHTERRGLGDTLDIGAALCGAGRRPGREVVAVHHVPRALGAQESPGLVECDDLLP